MAARKKATSPSSYLATCKPPDLDQAKTGLPNNDFMTEPNFFRAVIYSGISSNTELANRSLGLFFYCYKLLLAVET
jgi:hypothetical protein